MANFAWKKNKRCITNINAVSKPDNNDMQLFIRNIKTIDHKTFSEGWQILRGKKINDA